MAMRVRVRVPLASPKVASSSLPPRRAPRRLRTAPHPLIADETALPGHLLVLLSRLHRAEIVAAEAAAGEAQEAGSRAS